MKRFILSTFSILLATAAVAPTAQALPKIDTDFNIQTLRLSEFDARNKSEDPEQLYHYPQASTQPSTQSSPQSVSAEDTNTQAAETTVWESPKTQAEESQTLSLMEQRHQLLDRS